MDSRTNGPPHAADLRKHRRMIGAGTFFVTKSLQPKCPALTAAMRSIIADALAFYVSDGRLLCRAMVVMPDHWHVLFAPLQPASLSSVMTNLDRWIGRQTGPDLAAAGCRWQDGFHDTRIRSSRQFSYVAAYIERNPVQRELITSPDAWIWSSAHETYASMVTTPWPWEFEQDVER